MKEIAIVPKQVAKTLVGLTMLVVAMHVASFLPVALGWRDEPIHLLNMDDEMNFAAVYSTVLLWISACLLWFIGRADTDRRSGRKWLGWTALFAYLGADELLSFHERIAWVVHGMLGGLHLYGFAWVLPYGLAIAVLVALYARFWWSLPGDTRMLTALGSSLFVGGGIGCEIVGWVVTRMALGEWAWQLEILAEESLEMAGSITLVHAFMNHIDRHLPETRLQITSAVSRP